MPLRRCVWPGDALLNKKILTASRCCKYAPQEKNVLIKRTDIIENLGCASIIASDKVGAGAR